MPTNEILQQLADHKYAIDQSSIVAITDANGVITYVNERFCNVSGYQPEELVGKTHSILNSKYHPLSFFQVMWKTIKGGGVWRGEVRNRRKDGSYYWVDTTIVPFRNSQGAIYQFLSIRNEITDLKEAQRVISEQQARLAVASKFSGLGEMAANLTHEINNPLAAILGRCEMLLTNLERAELDKEYVRKSVETIEFTARRIEKIIRSMRSFSVARDGDPFEIKSLQSIVDETIDFVQQRFKDHGIDLLVNPIPPHLELECRGTEVSQVLLNLFNNAFDAVRSYEEKWVKVEVFSLGDSQIQIYVTDSGNGIDLEVAQRIFQPFFSTKEKQYGTGLGLSISKGLIEKHNGSIEIEHSFPKTRFVITLPLRQPNPSLKA
ncbi:MAG: hypothetical protein RJB66_219 [Pseudomonadota bacterium]|jgi:PAS domain S-box-containing protein